MFSIKAFYICAKNRLMSQKQQTINSNLLEELNSSNREIAVNAVEKIKSVASEEIIP